MKNLFSCGKNDEAVPTIGRSAVVIWQATRRKTTIHTFSPALDLPPSWAKPADKNRRPNQVAMSQKARWSALMAASDWVDSEKTQATGAKPISSTVVKASKPASNPNTSTSLACEPLRQEKI